MIDVESFAKNCAVLVASAKCKFELEALESIADVIGQTEYLRRKVAIYDRFYGMTKTALSNSIDEPKES